MSSETIQVMFRVKPSHADKQYGYDVYIEELKRRLFFPETFRWGKERELVWHRSEVDCSGRPFKETFVVTVPIFPGCSVQESVEGFMASVLDEMGRLPHHSSRTFLELVDYSIIPED